MKKIGLTIAGSDSSGGAGIQADIKSMEANGVFAMSVITGITAQNSYNIFEIQIPKKSIIKNQINCLFVDYKIDGIKIGALFNDQIMNIVFDQILPKKNLKIIIDPVMVSKAKVRLMKKNSINEFIKLFSKIDALITPNIDEASEMLGYEIYNYDLMIKAIRDLQKIGFNKILLKGSSLKSKFIFDLFSLKKDGKIYEIKKEKILTKNTHGTGCSLSSSILSYWIKNNNLKESIKNGIFYIHNAIKQNLNYGKGHGPINHFWKRENDFKK